MQNTASESRYKLVGSTGKVLIVIPTNGNGSIKYISKGKIFTAPARSIDGTEIKQGEEVVINKIDEHVFYVNRKN